MKQRGFTLVELLNVLALIGTLVFVGGFLYAGIHFLVKLW